MLLVIRGAQRASLQVGAASVAVMLAIAVAAPAAAHDLSEQAAEQAAIEASRQVAFAPALRPGDRVSDHGITLVVPEAGHGVWGELKFDDGTYQTLQIATTRAGVVQLLEWGDEVAAAHDDLLAASPGLIGLDPTVGAKAMVDPDAQHRDGRAECRDRDHNLFAWRTTRYQWRYSTATTPRKFRQRGGGEQAIIDAIIRANQNIVRATNVCGRSDMVSASFSYLGTTTRRTDVGTNGSCGRGDGQSVIGWGRLPTRSIAFTCVRWSGGKRSSEADIKLNWYKRYETTRSACSGDEFLIEAVMTHEMGHVYGLAHVSALWNQSLTMQPVIQYCSRSSASLGLGDMLGLERKY